MRKAHKKLRKGSSNVQARNTRLESEDRSFRPYYADYDLEEDDPESVITYLELINDFIKANI